MRGDLNRHGCGDGPARKGRGMEPDDLLCSRNARPEKGLAGLMARLGVPVGGRVRKLRAVEDHSAPIP
jgi:hypothetical protein